MLIGGVAGADIEPGLPDASIACSNHYPEPSERRDLKASKEVRAHSVLGTMYSSYIISQWLFQSLFSSFF